MKKNWFLVSLFVIFIWACSSDSSEEPLIVTDDGIDTVTFDRAAMLVNWTDNIILPAYVNFKSSLTQLQNDFDQFKLSPSTANLEILRSSWLASYRSWQRVSLFEIGPAEIVGLRLNINTYPVDIIRLEQHITEGNYDLSLPSNRDVKGFPALDYLINGFSNTDQEIVAKYSNDTNKEANLLYFANVLKDMNTLTDQVVLEWNENFRDTFINNDGASATASVDRMVNDYIFYYEKFLRAGKMGIPLGVFTGTVAPDRVEAYYRAEVSKVLFLEGLAAAQDFFNGKHFDAATRGESLASYLQTLNTVKNGAKLDEIINTQFEKARTLVTSLSTFKNEIETNDPPIDMLLAYDEVQRMVPLLKVDMVSAMSISIDFVDADGD